MSAPLLESFLAAIYVDPAARARFLADRLGETRRAGLSEDECHAMSLINESDLELASRSFTKKRSVKAQSQVHKGLRLRFQRLMARLRNLPFLGGNYGRD